MNLFAEQLCKDQYASVPGFSMNKKHIKTSTGENIWIFDNVYEADVRSGFNAFAEMSGYRIGGGSLDLLSHKSEDTIKCVFADSDLNNFGIFKHDSFSVFASILENRVPESSWILLSSFMSKYSFHPDALKSEDGKSFLYYVNTKWDDDWGGETLFCNKYGEVEIAVSFKPNRVVIFDSHIPHRPALISADAYPFRYTFVSQFKRSANDGF